MWMRSYLLKTTDIRLSVSSAFMTLRFSSWHSVSSLSTLSDIMGKKISYIRATGLKNLCATEHNNSCDVEFAGGTTICGHIFAAWVSRKISFASIDAPYLSKLSLGSESDRLRHDSRKQQ